MFLMVLLCVGDRSNQKVRLDSETKDLLNSFSGSTLPALLLATAEAFKRQPLAMATNITWHSSHMSCSDRECNLNQRGVTVSFLMPVP